MPNRARDQSPQASSRNLLMAYCQELNLVIQGQGEAVQQEDFDKMNETIKDFNRLKENIIKERDWLQNHEENGTEGRKFWAAIEDALHQAGQGSKANLEMVQESMNQIRTELNTLNQIGTYVNRVGGQHPKIIDKSV